MKMGKNLKLNAKQKRELIRFVKINPTLWNKTNSGYHNNVEKEKAWVAIGRAWKIKTSGDEIKAQFRNLRDRFAKEYKKQIRSQPSSSGAGRASTGEIYVSQWEFFQELSFLRDQIAPRPTTSNMASPDMSPKNEKKSEVKSDPFKLGDDSVNRLPSWFQTPETDDFSNSGNEKKGKRNRKLEKSGEDSASSDEDIDSDSDSDTSDSEHDTKKEKKVPDFDGFAKKR